MSNDFDPWCFCWPIEPTTTPARNRAALLKAARWPSRQRISVSFLDGQEEWHRAVEEVAHQWFRPGPSLFEFCPRGPTSVRISFAGSGCWSSLGQTCLNQAPHKPTMNLDLAERPPGSDEARRKILHEFGHVLGLIHEHQKPGHGIRWNRRAILDQLTKPPYEWNEQQIEENVFRAHANVESNFSHPDWQSIMVYPIPAHWTEDGFSVAFNSNLSANDRWFVGQYYR
jgi:serralysin